MRFLLTGATGFIGSHVAELLLSKKFEVVCPVRNTSSLHHLKNIPVTVVTYAQLESFLADCPPIDFVIHVAAATRGLNYCEYRLANVELTCRLLEMFSRIADRNFLSRFLLVSSQAASGPSSDDGKPFNETDVPKPVSLYGQSKLEAEQLVLSFKTKLPITVIRPSTVFGPRDTDVLGMFRCAKWRFVPCIAGQDRLVSIVYVEDLADGILTAAVSQASQGKTYFIANPEPVIWREFGFQVAEAMGTRAISLPVPVNIMKLVAKAGDMIGAVTGLPTLFRSEKLEEMKRLAWVCSANRIRSDLGWTAPTPIAQALEKTVQWYRDHAWL